MHSVSKEKQKSLHDLGDSGTYGIKWNSESIKLKYIKIRTAKIGSRETYIYIIKLQSNREFNENF